MKKLFRVITFVLALSLFAGNCYAAFVYPEYKGSNKNQAEINERINIVYDNSGHDDVKDMLVDILKASAIAENSDIWIYPVAGSAPPVKVVAGKEFMDKHFVNYAKSSNEFKDENVMQTAIDALAADTSVESKRFILYASTDTAQLNSNYDIHYGIDEYLANYSDVKFSVFYSFGSMLDKSDFVRPATYRDTNDLEEMIEEIQNGGPGSYDYISNCDLFGFLAVKNGYSKFEGDYNQDNGILKLPKGTFDNNVFVFAESTRDTYRDDDCHIYLGGCMMGQATFEKYSQKSEISGVALSYNHTLLTTENSVFAMFTADGDAINPAGEDAYIRLINASEVELYQRSKKGAGVCSKDTKYETKQDSEIHNVYGPQKVANVVFDTDATQETTGGTTSEPKGIVGSILSVILGIIGFILGLLFTLLLFLIPVFVIALIASAKFRSYIQLKILNTKFGPFYEKTVIKIKKFFADVAGAGVKIRGNADLMGDYIFISKASADMGLPNNRISLVIRELESRGISCWLSENGIKAGEDYNVVLPKAIKSCTLFLLFVSPMSIKSSDVVSEIGTAKEYKKNIIPVQIEPFDLFKQFPNWAYMLKQYQKTDLFASKQEDIKALADQIEKLYNENRR